MLLNILLKGQKEKKENIVLRGKFVLKKGPWPRYYYFVLMNFLSRILEFWILNLGCCSIVNVDPYDFTLSKIVSWDSTLIKLPLNANC